MSQRNTQAQHVFLAVPPQIHDFLSHQTQDPVSACNYSTVQAEAGLMGKNHSDKDVQLMLKLYVRVMRVRYGQVKRREGPLRLVIVLGLV